MCLSNRVVVATNFETSKTPFSRASRTSKMTFDYQSTICLFMAICKLSARNSGARNGCDNFMGAWDFLALSDGKPPMSIKFLVLGGGLGF